MSGEHELIDAASAGSVASFTALVAAYRERLLRFLVTRCPTHADAEDALQDTLLNAFRYLHTYDRRWRFSTWLYRIALRNAARVRTTEPTGEPADELADKGPDPLEHCLAADERDNLWLTARRVLADDVCTALWLRYVEDMSVNDVAAVLERTPSWTKVNLMRARRKLETALDDSGIRPQPDGSRNYGHI